MTPSLRAKVLREWQPFADHGHAVPKPATAMHALIPAVMKSLGLEQRLHESQVFFHWAEIVGADNARHCQPHSLRNGKLVINVTHSGWVQAFWSLKPMMLQKIQARIGKQAVRDIVFRNGG